MPRRSPPCSISTNFATRPPPALGSLSSQAEAILLHHQRSQILDYWPLGATRIETSYTAHDERQKFTGHELDGTGYTTYRRGNGIRRAPGVGPKQLR
jgi:hypothetical protein